MGDSTTKKAPKKPSLPKKCPLWAHPNGQLAKRIRGTIRYFGVWADPAAATERYEKELPYWKSGQHPPSFIPDAGGLTIRELCNKFMKLKAGRRDMGELAPRSWEDYFITCQLICDFFGKERSLQSLTPDDFERFRVSMSATRNPTTLGNMVQRVRVVMNAAYKQRWMDRPVDMGENFKKPSNKVLRGERLKRGPRMYEAREIRRVLKAADVQMRAMVLLGVNCGLGNADIGALPLSALDLNRGWLHFPRPKTNVVRKSVLWPETVAAIKQALAERPAPKLPEHESLVFITKYGGPWLKTDPKSRANPLSAEFRKLLKRLALYREGVGFYSLRHATETAGGEAKDQPALDLVMGHDPGDMASVYREGMSDARVRAVTDAIRAWLFRRRCADPWQSRRPLSTGSKRARSRKKYVAKKAA